MFSKLCFAVLFLDLQDDKQINGTVTISNAHNVKDDAYENIDVKRAGGRGFARGFFDDDNQRRIGGREFVVNTLKEGKRGGARWFTNGETYHSAERRAGERAFERPDDNLTHAEKRAGGRPFYENWKRADGRIFHFYDVPTAKRGGGRAFGALYSGNDFDSYYPKRGGSRPFYAASNWHGYPF